MMNRLITATLAGSLLVASAAVAGLNAQNPGLPRAAAWGIATSDGVATGIANNAASAMCVDCHTSNPVARRTAGKYAWQAPIANFQGTHYVGMSTNTGGGITWASPTARTAGQYLKLDGWYTTTAVSKYAVDGGTTAANYISYNTNNTLVRNATQDATVANYNTREIVCESCHSIILNVAGGRNLLNQNGAMENPTGPAAGKVVGDAQGNTGFCEGCHGDMTRANAKANNQPEGNNHHVVSITANSANMITNAKAASLLLWTRATTITGIDRALSTAPAYSGQNLEIGYRVNTTWSGGLGGIRSLFNCTDCHAYGHFGRTTMGARILRSGQGTEVGKAATGIQRASDVAARNQPTIFEDDQGYCQGCHFYAK